MLSSKSRQIEIHAQTGRADRLFRAAISAFCALTRPSRREMAQIEDLALSLFERAPIESRRYVAAALSECEYAPAALVLRLSEEPVNIAAPLLMRSHSLTDIDLIALIGRHGVPHAQAIAHRKNLNPTIRRLIRALEKPALVQSQPEPPLLSVPKKTDATDSGALAWSQASTSAEKIRNQLRSMMRPAGSEDTVVGPPTDFDTYLRLRETALSRNAAFFQTALADALGIDFETARALTIDSSFVPLLTALRAIDLGEDQAFLIVVAVHPTLFPHPQAIRLFLDKYRGLKRDAALDRVQNWTVETRSNAVRGLREDPANAQASLPSNNRDHASTARLKAS